MSFDFDSEEGAFVVLFILFFLLTMLFISGVSLYKTGFYEGRSHVLDNQVCVPREHKQ